MTSSPGGVEGRARASTQDAGPPTPSPSAQQAEEDVLGADVVVAELRAPPGARARGPASPAGVNGMCPAGGAGRPGRRCRARRPRPRPRSMPCLGQHLGGDATRARRTGRAAGARCRCRGGRGRRAASWAATTAALARSVKRAMKPLAAPALRHQPGRAAGGRSTRSTVWRCWAACFVTPEGRADLGPRAAGPAGLVDEVAEQGVGQLVEVALQRRRRRQLVDGIVAAAAVAVARGSIRSSSAGRVVHASTMT